MKIIQRAIKVANYLLDKSERAGDQGDYFGHLRYRALAYKAQRLYKLRFGVIEGKGGKENDSIS
jgi:hypothetical protein